MNYRARRVRLFGAATAALFILSVALVPAQARASEDGRKNTTLALGALTAYLFTRGGSKVPAFLGLGATTYAYKRYQDLVSARHRRERSRSRYYHSQYYRTSRHDYR